MSVIAVISGKGGVGKTTASANIGVALGNLGKTVIIIDFDIGQSNLDLILGVEQRIVYNIIDVLKKTVHVEQAIVKVKKSKDCFFLASSQTEDKTALKTNEIKKIINHLRKKYDFVILDAPAGIESGFEHSIEFADEAIVVVNPEVSSIRDSDRAVGLIDAKSKKGNVRKMLLINRIDAKLMAENKMISVTDIVDILDLPILGKVPEDSAILIASNTGKPAVLDKKSSAGQAYFRIAKRLAGEPVPLEPVEKESGFLRKIFK